MAFLLTTVAGLSTMLGTIPIFIKLKNENNIILASLAFAAGVMVTVSITDLIPEAIVMLRSFNLQEIFIIMLVFLFVLIGIFASFSMDRVLSTKAKDNTLYKVGIISMLAIIVHNLPEDCNCYVSH